MEDVFVKRAMMAIGVKIILMTVTFMNAKMGKNGDYCVAQLTPGPPG